MYDIIPTQIAEYLRRDNNHYVGLIYRKLAKKLRRKQMKTKRKSLRERGITLIALVITIIILLILACITLKGALGGNGLINMSKSAVNKYKEAAKNEDIELGIKMESIEGRLVSAIFDKNGQDEEAEGYNPNALHIGDFINYDAGTWTQDEINAIQVGEKNNLITPNGDNENLPDEAFEFGGFAKNDSRNGNAKPYYTTSYTYAQFSDGSYISGWRLFDVDEEKEVITLISAGCPEDYFNTNQTNYGYMSEYVLTGNVNSNATELNLENDYKKRDWNNYVNQKQHAIKASALEKVSLDNWYSKYFGGTSSDTNSFRKIYKTRYETLIDCYTFYWVATAGSHKCVYDINAMNRFIGHDALAVGGRRTNTCYAAN